MKTFYYGKLPTLERLSLPVTETAVEIYAEATAHKTLERLCVSKASEISRNACMSPCSFVLALMYLDRLKSANPAYFEKVTPSELFLISIMVATKFLNDSGEEDDVLNSEWACSMGLPLKDVNLLEKNFLNAIDWKVHMDQSDFFNKLEDLEKVIASREGRKRGWFTYTDLQILLEGDYINCLAVAQSLLTVSAVCLASYMAGMLAVIGSTLVATHIVDACTNVYRQPFDFGFVHQQTQFDPALSQTQQMNNTMDEDCAMEALSKLLARYNEKEEEEDEDEGGFSVYNSTHPVIFPSHFPIDVWSSDSGRKQYKNYLTTFTKFMGIISPGGVIPTR